MHSTPALAIVRDYSDLHAALRHRANEMGLSRESLDDLAGLAKGHTAMILGPRPSKRLGWVSTGPVLGALGVALAVIADPEAVARIERRLESGLLTRRDEKFVRSGNHSRA